MRIYLPSTVAELRADVLAARVAHAVTPALRSALPEEDDEGLEYAAQLFAADDSLELLDPGAGAGRRRLVIAADVPEGSVRAAPSVDHAPSAVHLTASVGWSDVACAHVDEADAEDDVAAASTGDEEAVDRLADRDLLWYDVSELPALLRSVLPG